MGGYLKCQLFFDFTATYKGKKKFSMNSLMALGHEA
jgi:hypothetical protein